MRVGAFLFVMAAASAQSDPVGFFETRIQPLLAEKCYTCHTGAMMGGLRLDSREAVLAGGKSGPAVTPGRPDDSLLIQAVSQMLPKLRMPPQGKLEPDQIASLRRWIEDGAHWPGATATAVSRIDPKQHWAFQPVRKPAIPPLKNDAWANTPIDRFVAAKLEARGLAPVPAASRRVLLRRATYDLIGQPPTPAEVNGFLEDSSPDAFAKVLDRLLASPHYGERWGRHWLDVARYADDDQLGLSADPFPNAFRYRDWVVRAFNEDMPF